MCVDVLGVLLVEDNPDHAEFMIRNLADLQVACRIHHVLDGEGALDYLFHRGDYSDPAKSPRPHVILLDLRLPKIDGLEVLAKVKATEGLRGIPVVIVTASQVERDLTVAYDRYANSYLVKPVDFVKFTQLMEALGFYWLGWNRYPSGEAIPDQ